MRSSTLAVLLTLLVVLVASSAGAPASATGSGDQAAAAAVKAKKKPKAKRKRCRKGYVLRTVKVKRKGKTVRVKRCRKRRAAKKRSADPPTTPAPAPAPQPTLPADDAARQFVEARLADTRFTNCVDGWNLMTCLVETRYSHFPDGRFVYCRVTPGPRETVGTTFELQSPRTEPDGSWSFDSVVPGHGKYSWRVSASGQVTGSFQVAGEDKATALLPLQQVAGARDCAT